jgi:hypothetical protein
MRIILDASPDNRQALKELLSSRGITVVKKSPVTFAPRGSTLPDKGLVVVYDPSHPDELLDFIDSMGVLAGKAGDEMIIGRHKQGFVIIQAEDILYFVAWGNYVYCKILNERFEVNRKLYEVERNFKKKYFIRINKSYVVNIRWIQQIIPWFGGRLLLKLKEIQEELEVSRSYVRAFKQSLGI